MHTPLRFRHHVSEASAAAVSPAGRARPRTVRTVRGLVASVRVRDPRAGQLNEPPQAQDDPAFGLSMVKPCFSMVSAKSMVAPSR